MVDFHICYILQELVVDLSWEPEKENSLCGNNGLKVENEKTKKMKRENLKEISNGNNVDDACENKKLKRPKLSNGVSDGDLKKNADAEMETKVEQTHVMIHGQMDAPKACSANDDSFIPNLLHERNCQGTVVIADGQNAGAKSQTNAIALNTEKINEEIPLPLGTEMTKILDLELAPEDVGNALQFLEFCRVFGKVFLYTEFSPISLVNNLLLLHLVVYKLNIIFIVANSFLKCYCSYTQYLVGSISKQILFSF